MFGLLGVIFGILGFFSIGLVFIPLGLLCTVISLVSKRGFLLGFIGLIMNIVAIAVSPSVWVVIAGIIGSNINTPAKIENTSMRQLVNTASTDIKDLNQEQPKQEALYQELKQELEQDKTKNISSTDAPQMMVMRMLEYALDDGGLNHESEIQQTKLQIESLPRPAKGNKKAARVFNADGLASSKNYDFNNAVKMFEEANKLDKSDIESVSNLGFAYLKQGNLDLAQQAITTTLTMSPGRAIAWANLGEIFGIRGDVSKAVACFSNTYRFSKDRLKTYQYMKKLNETEDVATVKQARTEAINWAEKSYPDISINANPIKEAENQQPPVAQKNAAGYWYYCNNPAGYYPYIKTCPNGWQQVPPKP